jgi:hypothetical protein
MDVNPRKEEPVEVDEGIWEAAADDVVALEGVLAFCVIITFSPSLSASFRDKCHVFVRTKPILLPASAVPVPFNIAFISENVGAARLASYNTTVALGE